MERIHVESRTILSNDRAHSILQTCKLQLFFITHSETQPLFSYLLIVVGQFMAQKEHVTLCTIFEERFPNLFGFKQCGLLFIDSGDGCMYRISEPVIDQDDIPAAKEPNEDNPECTTDETAGRARHKKPIMMRLPQDRGITGIAIQTR